MVEHMKVVLKMIENMVRDMNNFQMVQYMMACLLMGNQKEKENLHGVMEKVMKENGWMDWNMGKEFGMD